MDEKSYDQLTYDEALQIASESKDEVKRQLLLRSENFDKAYAAYRRGNSAVAAYYSEMVIISYFKINLFFLPDELFNSSSFSLRLNCIQRK